MPFKDTLDDPNGAFQVEVFEESTAAKNIHAEQWENEEREFSAEDFYTVLIGGTNYSVSD